MRVMMLLKQGTNLSNLKDDPFQKFKVSALRLSVTLTKKTNECLHTPLSLIVS